MTTSYEILLHGIFRADVRKTLKRYTTLRKRLVAELVKLQQGPRGKHAPMRGVDDPELQGLFRRTWVGRHRLIYLLDEQNRRIIPVFLSGKPRSEDTYVGWQAAALEITFEYRSRNVDQFEIWQGDL
ncbi:MAG: hypothetical protein OXF32_10110 [Anaerolineaceae bacterium]|nr:hypothetical protein [Anaerolineaceae bacterium]